LHFSFRHIIISCLIVFIFSGLPLSSAQPEVLYPSLADRLAQNTAELEQATKNLYAANALLAEENKNLSGQILLLEEKVRLLSKDLEDFNSQQKKPSRFLVSKKEPVLFSLGSATGNDQRIDNVSEEQENIRGEIASELKKQDSLRSKGIQLHEDIRRLEQDNFSQQRLEREFFNRFKDAYSSAQSFFDLEINDQKKIDCFLEKVNFFIIDAYERLSMLSMDQKKLKKDLADQKAVLENADEAGEGRDGLVAKLVILQVENEDLKNALVLQRNAIPVPKRLITNSRIESLTAILKVQRAENKSFKSELSRLSQSIRRLNKQKADIKKTLQKQ